MKKMWPFLFFVCLQNGLFAQEGEAPPARDQGFSQTLVMIAIAILFFYFIFWRPEQKRRKAMEDQRNSLKKGDRVTAVGIVGTIAKVQEHTVILKMVDGNRIEVLKAVITDVIPGTEDEGRGEEKMKAEEKDEG